MLAAVVTSLLRRRLSRRAWRAVHLTAYLSWPVAWFHSVFASGDLRHGPLFLLAVACAVAVVGATGWRVAVAARDVPRAERVGLLMAAVHARDKARGSASHDTARERTLAK
jgi:sulfoxide reductase heme-binding subunit YedZ